MTCTGSQRTQLSEERMLEVLTAAGFTLALRVLCIGLDAVRRGPATPGGCASQGSAAERVR